MQPKSHRKPIDLPQISYGGRLTRSIPAQVIAKWRTKITPNARFIAKTFAYIKDFHYLRSKLSNNRFMSATDYLNNAQVWLAQQSQRTIDYQWEIQHHNQMHKTYETSL